MNTHCIGRRAGVLLPLVLTVAVAGALIVPAAAAAANPMPAGPAGTAGAGRGFTGDDGSKAAPLPMIRKVLPNGIVVKQADPKALQSLIRLATGDGCGRQCDAQNPATYVYKGPGGPSNWYPCSYDAVTVEQIFATELRYSPRCRTAWTRGAIINALETDSWYLNGNFRTFTYEDGYPMDPDKSRTHFTAMVDDADLLADACGFDYSGGNWRCTARY